MTESLVPQESDTAQDDSQDLLPLIDTIPKEWQVSAKTKKAVCAALVERGSKYKLYAPLPIVCRGDQCAYHETCFLFEAKQHPKGGRCPLEIAQAIDVFESYCKELNIQDGHYVDLQLVRDLVDIDLQISRADRILATDGSLVQYVPVGVDDKGKPIWRPDIHVVMGIKERLLKHKREIMSALNATRKDKAEDERAVMDPSTIAAALLERKRALDRARSSQLIDTTLRDGRYVAEEKDNT